MRIREKNQAAATFCPESGETGFTARGATLHISTPRLSSSPSSDSREEELLFNIWSEYLSRASPVKEKKDKTMSEPFDINLLQEPLNLPFPAVTKQVAGVIQGIQTDVTLIKFSDRILVTISQKGRLGHWVGSFIS